jgi:hypothetical protein
MARGFVAVCGISIIVRHPVPSRAGSPSRGHPDFRVGGRIFMTLWPGDKRAVVKLPPADQQALVQMDPDAFSLGGWSHQGWTNIRLARVNAAQLRLIAQAAWRNVASKKLLALHPPAA